MKTQNLNKYRQTKLQMLKMKKLTMIISITILQKQSIERKKKKRFRNEAFYISHNKNQ